MAGLDLSPRKLFVGARYMPLNDAHCRVRVIFVRTQTQQENWRKIQIALKEFKQLMPLQVHV